MPKKPPKNAFFFYMLHFKEEERKRGRYYPGGLQEVSDAASQSWKEMNAQQRGPFEKKAVEAKMGPRREVEKFTSQGIPLSLIAKEQKELENEHRTMLRTIKEMVSDGFTNNTMGSQEIFVISGNHFINANENYLPAEIALAKFSFESGILSKFHTYVNPENVPIGYKFDARENSDKTHRLPIPPNAKGERNYQHILEEMNRFMGRPTPIMFTAKDNIPMIKSFIQQFVDSANDDGDVGCYRIYPLHQLFYEIKEEAVRNSVDGTSFKSIHIAEEHLRRDDYVYLSNTACAYHDEIDCAKHCALAHVQIWAYIFCDHICHDLNIQLVTGKHFPPEIDVSHVDASDFSSSKLNVTEDTFTRDTETERQPYDNKSSTSVSSHWQTRPKSPATSSRDDDFPSLGSHKNRAGASRKSHSDQRDVHNPWNTSSSSSSDGNPWNQRQERTPNLNETDDGSFRGSDSSYSRGMGRGSVLFRNESGFGRGRSHNDHNHSSGRNHSDSSRRHDSNSYHSRESETVDYDNDRRQKRRRH